MQRTDPPHPSEATSGAIPAPRADEEATPASADHADVTGTAEREPLATRDEPSDEELITDRDLLTDREDQATRIDGGPFSERDDSTNDPNDSLATPSADADATADPTANAIHSTEAEPADVQAKPAVVVAKPADVQAEPAVVDAEPAVVDAESTVAEPGASEHSTDAEPAVGVAEVAIPSEGTSMAVDRLLDGAVAGQFFERLRDVQAAFVDDPAGAVHAADALVDEVTAALTTAIDQQRRTIAYSNGVTDDNQKTELLRTSLQNYRRLVSHLLEV